MITIGETNIVKAYLGQTELANVAIGDNLLLSSEPLPYLKFTALEDGTFKYAKALEYSLDGSTWTSLAANTASPTIHTGEYIMWRGSYTPGSGSNTFVSTGRFDAEGDPRSIIYGNNFMDGACKAYMFYKLFQDCVGLVHADMVLLPMTGLLNYAYMSMFQGCTSLVSVPVLTSATFTGSSTFRQMFQGCTSLTTPPALPNTPLTSYCYGSMFKGCTALTSAPTLAATTLASECYMSMFDGCTSLATPPDLPSTTLVKNCYNAMFKGCTSLTRTPTIAPTTVAETCCNSMFYGCSSITTFNVSLPATTLVTGCYNSMFYNCKEMVTAPVLPATTLVTYCYYMMFRGCSKLNYIKAMFTDASASNCLSNWVNGVASSGTFVKNANSTFNTRGASGIPNNWTIETASE